MEANEDNRSDLKVDSSDVIDNNFGAERLAEQAQQLLEVYSNDKMSHPERIDALKAALLQVDEGFVYGHHASLADPMDLTNEGLLPRTLHNHEKTWDIGVQGKGGQVNELYVDPSGIYFTHDIVKALVYFDNLSLQDNYDKQGTFIYSAELPLRNCNLDPEELYVFFRNNINPFSNMLIIQDEHNRNLVTDAYNIFEELCNHFEAILDASDIDILKLEENSDIPYDGVQLAHKSLRSFPFAKQRLLVSAASKLPIDSEYLLSFVYSKSLPGIEPNGALNALRQEGREYGDNYQNMDREAIEKLLPRYTLISELNQCLENMPGSDHLEEDLYAYIKTMMHSEILPADINLQEIYEHLIDLGTEEEELLKIIEAAEKESIKLDLQTREEELSEYPIIQNRYQSQSSNNFRNNDNKINNNREEKANHLNEQNENIDHDIDNSYYDNYL